MSIKKKLAVAGLAVALGSLSSVSFADLEVTPYGAAQYRLRFQHNLLMPDEGDNQSAFDYSNRLCWRMGTKAKWDDVLSLQFQIGNDWGAAENVNWNSNNGPRNRVFSGVSFTPVKTTIVDGEGNDVDVVTGGSVSLSGYQNLYAHLAYARWNPGFMFIEAGIIPLNDNGTLGLLESSLASNRYASAGFNGWGDWNNSVIGLKVGAPVVKDGVKVGVELTQAIVDNRTQTLAKDPKGNPPSMMMDVQIPVDAGAFKITPEITAVINRNYNNNTEKADHEMLFGAAGSFKVNDQLSLSFNGGFGMVSNENSQAGAYGAGGGASSSRVSSAAKNDDFAHYASQGYLVGAGVTYKKLGPGDLQFAINYNGSENTEAEKTDDGQLYTDLRYIIKLHKNFAFTPRYRTYTTMFANDNTRMDNRFELIFEGSF